jgi:hypothetical protein
MSFDNHKKNVKKSIQRCAANPKRDNDLQVGDHDGGTERYDED